MYKYFHLSQNLCARKSCAMKLATSANEMDGRSGRQIEMGCGVWEHVHGHEERERENREKVRYFVIASSLRRRNARFKCKKRHHPTHREWIALSPPCRCVHIPIWVAIRGAPSAIYTMILKSGWLVFAWECVYLAKSGWSERPKVTRRMANRASKKACERLHEQRAKRTSESDNQNIYGVKIGAAH